MTILRGTLPALLAAAVVGGASGVLVAAIGGLVTETYGTTLVVAWAHISLWSLPVLVAGWVVAPPGPDGWSAIAERFSAAGIAAQRGFVAVIGLGLLAFTLSFIHDGAAAAAMHLFIASIPVAFALAVPLAERLDPRTAAVAPSPPRPELLAAGGALLVFGALVLLFPDPPASTWAAGYLGFLVMPPAVALAGLLALAPFARRRAAAGLLPSTATVLRRAGAASAAFLCLAGLLVPFAPDPPVTASAQWFVLDLYKDRRDPGWDGLLDGRSKPALSPDLLVLVLADRGAATGKTGALDLDPLCLCQDPEGLHPFGVDVTPLAPGRVRTDVDLAVAGERKVVSLILVRARERWGAWTSAGWRVDDVEDADGKSLRRRLAAGGWTR